MACRPSRRSRAGAQLERLVIAAIRCAQVKILLAVGAGVTGGEYVNRAQGVNVVTGNAMSGEATATVRLAPDPTFDCSDVTGKVFSDANRNGRQDDGEEGCPALACGNSHGVGRQRRIIRAGTTSPARITPNENRGSNFVLKLD
jgi:hypothetical protein